VVAYLVATSRMSCYLDHLELKVTVTSTVVVILVRSNSTVLLVPPLGNNLAIR